MPWRPGAERRRPEDVALIARIERRAERLVAASLVLLVGYVTCDAAWTLWHASRPDTSRVGMALNAAMGWWWADPVAALGVAALVLVEARSAWRGDECGSGCRAPRQR